MFTLEAMRPVANSTSDGTPMPAARVFGVRASSIAPAICSTSLASSESSVCSRTD
jgi:hypothetical protein